MQTKSLGEKILTIDRQITKIHSELQDLSELITELQADILEDKHESV